MQLSKTHAAKDAGVAPGGKCCPLLNELPETALLVANEVICSRYQDLRQNLAKWGLSNVVVTNADPQQLAPMGGSFDLPLVDAHWSGEGLFRKQPEAAVIWTSAQIQRCEDRQRRIMSSALPLLRPGGFLLCSTGTYNAQENDGNVAWLVQRGDYEVLTPEIPP